MALVPHEHFSKKLNATLFVAISLLLIYFHGPISHVALQLYHSNSWEHAVDTYDFQDTELEKLCFVGTAQRDDGLTLPPIPYIVHFIWIGNPDLSFIGYLAIRSAILSLRPQQIKLHYTTLNWDNGWFRKIEQDITPVRHDLGSELRRENLHVEKWGLAHQSDMLRLQILFNEGGIYMDMDVFSLRPFDSLLTNQRDVVLGHEGGNRAGLCNAVIAARPGSPFLHRWIDTYTNFSLSEWNYHSVILPKKLSLQHPNEACVLAPTAFFWPTWTYKHIEFMHSVLTPEEAVEVMKNLETNDGALYESQLTYHAWSQVSWRSHLRHLTPDRLKSEDTRFNMMVRKFL